jgi:PAS domain S-box-containing protein
LRLEHEGSRPQENPSTRPVRLHDSSKLRASEQRFRRLVTSLNDIVYTVDAEGRFTYISHRVKSISGYKPSELLGRPFSDFIHPEDLPVLLEVWRGRRKGGPAPVECRIVMKNGQYRFVRVSGRRQLKNGHFAGAAGIFTDASEQHEAESALRESESKYRALFEQSIDAVSLVTPQGRITEANASWFRLFGYSPGDLKWLNARDTYAEPGDRDVFLRKIAETGSLVDDEVRVKKKDGTVMDCLRSVTVRRTSDGGVIGYQSVFHDITERKRAEAALREREERFRMVLTGSPVIVAHVDRDLRYTWIHNPHPDFDPASVRGKRDDELAVNEGTRQLARLKRQVIETGSPARAIISFPLSEGERTYDTAAEPVKDDSGMVIGATTVAFDITERTRAEEALRESEEKYRQLFDQSIAPISLVSPDGRLIEANDAWFRLLGYSREDMVSFRAANLFPSPEMREDLLRRLLDSGSLVDDESRVKTKDGTLIDVLRSMSIRYNPDGSVFGFQTVLRDVTELKHTRDELFASREQLRRLALRIQEAREEERTTIAQELHNHFGQQLTALRLDLDSLTRSGPPEGDTALVRIRGIKQLVDRMSQEVRRLISEMRPGMLDDLGLCAAIEWQAGQFSERTGIACGFILTADDARLPATASTALFRVLQELLSNVARHARATSVNVSLTSDSDSVCLRVADNGRGITDEELGSSTSLGILGMRERIRACKGTVDFHSKPGMGTTVTITVPIQPAANGQ